MDINSPEFLLKEAIRRVANGGYLNTCYRNGACYFAWGIGFNPLEAAGVIGPHTEEIESNLNKITEAGTSVILAVGELGDDRVMVIYPNLETIDDVDPQFQKKMFPTLLSLLTYLRENMGPTGNVTMRAVEAERSRHELLKGWSLNKDTYTNQEVRDIIEELRNEMTETINQLANRLINRIKN